MSGYKKCPRCELNWIKGDEDLCDVCKAELKLGGISLIEDDEVEEVEERICPVCKINLLDDGEEMCATCREEKLAKINDEAEKEEDEESDDGWREFVEEDVLETHEDTDEILLGDLEEDESEKEEILEEEEGFDDLDIAYDYEEDLIEEDEDEEEDDDE